MMWQNMMAMNGGQSSSWILAMPFVIFILVAWSAVWKGLALWRAGRKNHLAWFVVLLVVNTCGILEIIYLLTAGKNTPVEPTTPAVPQK